MIKGTGIDIVEVDRIKNAIKKSEHFKQFVFSPEEIEYCEAKANSFESFAGRFAAKEAFFKALGTGWQENTAFNEVVVSSDPLGRPFIKLVGETEGVLERTSFKIHLSISHTKEYATAMVIIEE
jgi:holo-[acyl-carrier protein] synthase